MRLATALAVAAATIGGVAAFAVPLPPAPGRISINEPAAPDWRRPDDTGASTEVYHQGEGDRLGVGRAVEVATTTRTEFETVLTTSTVTPTASAPTTLSPPSSITAASSARSCDLRYCDAGTSYCEYWGGYSSFDVSLGRPIPGETRTSVGVCTGITPVLGSHTSKIWLSSEPGGGSSSTSTSTSTSSASATSAKATISTSHNPLDTLTCTSTIE
ncbi:hypothetical protein SCUCBS95973_003218 [Sporothrix curviconia]|uniref:Uncharacterized protein n=1 Tax=Sporothrix curviconia TaxID=1260050 RepID=A0ABP0BEL3_9PEZI